MTNQQHPITPPSELVKQWVTTAHQQDTREPATVLATQAARWGADTELEACCEWLDRNNQWARCDIDELHDARRPKPPSLKEQALKELEWVDKNLKMPLLNQCTAIHTIRHALEQLDD